jgi:hypothetical protein
MPEHWSFFHLTAPRPAPQRRQSAPRPDRGGVRRACCAEAHPLFQALIETVNTYCETHPEVRLLAVYIAADMLRELVKQDLREAQADA